MSTVAARPRPVVGQPDADEWLFLGVRVTVLSREAEQVIVAEATLPAGASPPLHVHEGLDDSFYVIEGTIVVRCGDEVSLASSGSWIPFPRRVPHTFRVMGGPARILLVHANDSFLRAVKDIGRPATAGDVPSTGGGPSPEELDAAMAEHDISTVGAPMEEDEARAWLERLSGDEV